MCYVTDSFGSFVGSETITILPAPDEELMEEPENRRPSVEITRPTTNVFYVDQIVLFSASGSDPDGDALTYTWDFGDGTTANFPIVSHRYERNGFFTVVVTVSDGELVASDRVILGIRERPEAVKDVNERPVAVIRASDRFVGPDDIVVLNALMSYDPDGRIASYEWILRSGAEFAFGDSNDGLITIRFNRNGFHRVDLRVTDDDGATDSAFVLILVSDAFAENGAPVADAGDDIDAFAGDDINFDGSGSFDSDGEIVSYEWDFGDGTSETGVNPSHIYNTPGIYEVTLTVTDDDGATDTETISISITSATVFTRELDADKRPRILAGDGRADFEFGRVIPSVEKRFYSRGENIMLFVKIANEASRDVDLDFVLSVPELSYWQNVNNINVDSGQTKFVTVFLNIPGSAAPGNYVARLSLDSGEEIKRDYWQFAVA